MGFCQQGTCINWSFVVCQIFGLESKQIIEGIFLLKKDENVTLVNQSVMNTIQLVKHEFRYNNKTFELKLKCFYFLLNLINKDCSNFLIRQCYEKVVQ